MSQTFTPADVSAHNNPDKGMYIIIDNSVYDVTKFVDEHPGGAKILKRVAGKDASKQFWKVCLDLFLSYLVPPFSVFILSLLSGLRVAVLDSCFFCFILSF